AMIRSSRMCATIGILTAIALPRLILGAARAGELGLAASPYTERWVYCSANLQVDQSVEQVIALIEKTKRSGYTGIMLADYKLQVLYRVPEFYFRNVERVKAAAAKAGIELIPAVFSIGYSNGHLAADPNLAEGLPVIDQPFVVKNWIHGATTKGSVGKSRPKT